MSKQADEQQDPIVFIVDDDISVCRSLSRLLTFVNYRVEVFTSAEVFLQRLPYEGVGLILLDVSMPEINGLELQEKLLKMECTLPIIFLTGHGDIKSSVVAIKKGAYDFLTKPVDDQLLLAALGEAIINYRAYLHRHKAQEVIQARFDKLTEREHQVLLHVINGERNKVIGEALYISEKTVKVHRAHIMEKIRVSSLAELVRLSIECGIILESEESILGQPPRQAEPLNST